MKHFEELWEDSENKIDRAISPVEAVAKICEQCSKILMLSRNDEFSNNDNEKMAANIGKLLLATTVLSKYFNVNVYAALQNELNLYLKELYNEE